MASRKRLLRARTGLFSPEVAAGITIAELSNEAKQASGHLERRPLFCRLVCRSYQPAQHLP
jgi:hypothetical protein